MRFPFIGLYLVSLLLRLRYSTSAAFSSIKSSSRPRQNDADGKRPRRNTGDAGGPLPQSDRVLHVGNLDWTTPPGQISDAIYAAVGGSAESAVAVTVKGLPRPLRKRDEGKYHGGSATVAFLTNGEARAGMDALRDFSDAETTGGREGLRLRWASISTPGVGRGGEVRREEAAVVSEERALRRKSRAESYARRRKRVARRTDEVIASLMDSEGASQLDARRVLDAPLLDWSGCPEEIDPVRGGGLGEGTARGKRKRAAVEAFLLVVRAALIDPTDNSRGSGGQNMARRRRRFVADLGCGAGNLSIPLAWWLQEEGYGVLGVDINGVALKRLEKRARSSGIAIETLEEDLLRLISNGSAGDNHGLMACHQLSDCSAVVSLHACGAASDLSMAAAIENSLPFAISPCCIGKVNTPRLMPGRMPSLTSGDRSAAPPEISYPRSVWLNDMLSFNDYQLLAAAADYGVGGREQDDDAQELARRERCSTAKQIVETDRLEWAQEKGYYVRMVELPRIGPIYPKRELLLGAKKGSSQAIRISRLPTTLS